MTRLWQFLAQFLGRIFRRINPLDAPLATLEGRKADAEHELALQWEGLAREQAARSDVKAEIDRLIIAATRDVLRKRPMRR